MKIYIERLIDGRPVKEEIDLGVFLSLRVEVDGHEFAISADDDALEVRQPGSERLVIEPRFANAVRIRSTR